MWCGDTWCALSDVKVINVKLDCNVSILHSMFGCSLASTNKTLWEHILGRHCIRHVGMYISWESACTSVQAQGLMIGRTEFLDSLVCR